MSRFPWRAARFAIVVAAAATLAGAGCSSGAHRSTTALPGADLAGLRSFYVQHQPSDTRNIHSDIAEQLRALGFTASADEGPPPEGEFDGLVTYVDRIMWDMSNYCIQLTIYIRGLTSGYIVATGSSFRPSMVRKTPAGHAKLILTDLFGGAEAK
jgi:hypothetical protein